MFDFFNQLDLKFRSFLYKDKIKSRDYLIKNSYDFFSQKNVLFIHIPKTAGVSVYDALFGVDSLGHIPISDYYGFYGEKRINQIFKFCFVRNPYDRLYSAFTYLKKGGRGLPSDLDYQKRLEGIENFEDFVLNHLNKESINSLVHFRTQTSYLINSKGKLCIDFIGKFENLEKDYETIAKRINTKMLPLPEKNMSKKLDFNLDDKIKTAIYNFYKVDFINFGYRN